MPPEDFTCGCFKQPKVVVLTGREASICNGHGSGVGSRGEKQAVPPAEGRRDGNELALLQAAWVQAALGTPSAGRTLGCLGLEEAGPGWSRRDARGQGCSCFQQSPTRLQQAAARECRAQQVSATVLTMLLSVPITTERLLLSSRPQSISSSSFSATQPGRSFLLTARAAWVAASPGRGGPRRVGDARALHLRHPGSWLSRHSPFTEITGSGREPNSL
jgi:hypothetical protein